MEIREKKSRNASIWVISFIHSKCYKKKLSMETESPMVHHITRCGHLLLKTSVQVSSSKRISANMFALTHCLFNSFLLRCTASSKKKKCNLTKLKSIKFIKIPLIIFGYLLKKKLLFNAIRIF